MSYYVNLKLVLPFIYLLLLPYQNLKALLIIIIFIILNNNKKVYVYKIAKSIKSNIIFFVYISFNNLYTNYKYFNVINILKQTILIPYFFKVSIQQKYYYNLHIFYMKLILPKYSIKIIVITILQIVVTNNLLFFMKNEKSLVKLSTLIKNNYKTKNYNFKLLLLSILTSYEIMEKVLNKFYNFYIGLKFKSYVSLYKYIKYFNYFKANIFNQIIEESYYLMLTLWNRF